MDEERRGREREHAQEPDDDGALGRAVAARLRAGEEVGLDLRWRFAPHPARTLEADAALDLWIRRPSGERCFAGRTGDGPVPVPEHAALWLAPAEGVPLEQALEALRGLGATGLVVRARGDARRRAPRPELEALAGAAPDLTHLLLAGWDLSPPDALAPLAALPALEELALSWERDPATPWGSLGGDPGESGLPEPVPELPPRRLAPSPALASLPRLRVLELDELHLALEDDWPALLAGARSLRRLVLPTGARFATGRLAALLAALDLEALHLAGDGMALTPAVVTALGRMSRLLHLRTAARLSDPDCALLAGLPLPSLRIGWCSLTAAGLSALGALPALRHLALCDAWLDEAAQSAVASLRRLEGLDLTGCRGFRDLRRLGELPRLTALGLDLGLHLADVSPRRQHASPLRGAALPGLRTLELREQVEDDRLPDALAAAPGLTRLRVSTYGAVSAGALADVARLPGLRALELAGSGGRWRGGDLVQEPRRALAPLLGRPLEELRVLGVPGLARASLAGRGPARVLVSPTRPESPWRT